MQPNIAAFAKAERRAADELKSPRAKIIFQ